MQKSRQELISLIESGSYGTKKSGGVRIVTIVFLLSFLAIFATTFFMAVPKLINSNDRIGSMFGVVVPVFVVFIVLTTLLSRVRGKAVNLTKLSPQDRELLMNGEIIEAELDSIEQVRNGYQIKCSANYQGQRIQFSSPIIGVRPIPFEEQKIDVYIDSQKPSRYLVDFYNHIPLANRGNVMQDRSGLKCEPHPQMQNVSDKGLMVAVTVICCMVAGGISLVNLVFLIVGIATMKTGGFNFGSIAVNLFVLIMVPTFAFLIIRSVKNSISARKAVLAQGYYIEAVGDKAWTTSDDDGDRTYHLSARYIEPKTKIMHEFTDSSSSSWISRLVGVKIRVYVNPDNTEQYVMCSREAEKEMGFTASREDNNE